MIFKNQLICSIWIVDLNEKSSEASLHIKEYLYDIRERNIPQTGQQRINHKEKYR